MTRKPKHLPSGFTLVELLVVITIILVLAALSFLGFGRIRMAADTANTVSNMRQLQTANVSYATDHNGHYASYYNRDQKGAKVYWYRTPEFLAYLTGDDSQLSESDPSLDVPLNLLDPTVVRARQRWFDNVAASYGMNNEFMTKRNPEDTERYIEMNGVTDPSRSFAFITATDSSAKYAGRTLWWNSPVEGKTTDGKMAFRHGNKAIAVYFDGSTGFITKGDIERIDAKGGKNNIFWKANY